MKELQPGSEETEQNDSPDTLVRLRSELAATRRELRLRDGELGQVRQQLSRLSRQLSDVHRDTATLASSISHDLRSPLNTINGFCYLLNKNYRHNLDGRGQEFLDLIVAGTKRMSRLIDDIVGLMRTGVKQPSATRVDLSGLAEETVRQLRLAEPARTVEVRITPGLTVTADEGLLRVVVEHLLGNAWKFTRNSPAARIELGSQLSAGETVYFVRDNGAGFEMENAAGLFTPFKRLHSPKEFEGVGIGLALVERIVRNHNGRVWAQAAENEGATFFFTLSLPPPGSDSPPT